MCEIQGVISASAKMAIYSEEKPSHQWLCWGLNLSYFKQ